MKYLIVLFSLITFSLFGQSGIEPTSFQGTPYKGGVMVGVTPIIDEFTGDTIYLYQHSDTSFVKIDSLVFTDSLRLYTSQGVFTTYISAGGGSGDITAVTVSAPITGGGTSGSVNIGIDTTSITGAATQYDLTLKENKLTGTAGQTLRFGGTNTIIASSLLYNNGTSIGIGTVSPIGGSVLTVEGASIFSRPSFTDATIQLYNPANAGAGILFDDTSTGSDYMYYHGQHKTFTFGTGIATSTLNKKLNVLGGVTIGSGYSTTAVDANSLNIEGSITIGTTTGTPATNAAFDSSGKLVSTTLTTGTVTGSGTSGYLSYFSGTSALADSPLYRNGSTQISLGTTTNTNLLGRAGFNIMSADPAFAIGKSTSHYWYTYLNGNNLELYNPNYGAVANWQTDGKLKMPKYSGTGNRYLYATSTGEINSSLYDAASTSGTGTNGYVPRYFNATTFDRTGLYCTADAGNNFGIGTTSPSTYGITAGGGLAIYNATDPRFALANTSNTWINYLTSGTYNIYSTAFGDVVSLTSNGRMGINKASPSTRLHVGGDVTIDTRTGTGTSLAMYDSGGKLCTATLGTGVSISSGILNFTETDGSITNEGYQGVTAGSSTSSVIQGYNSAGTATGTGTTINVSGSLSISETTSTNGGQITLTGGYGAFTVAANGTAGSQVVTVDGTPVLNFNGGSNMEVTRSVDDFTFNSIVYYAQLSNNALITPTLDNTNRIVDFGVANETNNTQVDADITTNLITADVSGNYEVSYNLSYTLPTPALRDVTFKIYKAGSDIGYDYTAYSTHLSSTSSVWTPVSKTFHVFLTAGETIGLYYISSGSSTTINIASPVLSLKKLD